VIRNENMTDRDVHDALIRTSDSNPETYEWDVNGQHVDEVYVDGNSFYYDEEGNLLEIETNN
jgi:hypothetical protein